MDLIPINICSIKTLIKNNKYYNIKFKKKKMNIHYQ